MPFTGFPGARRGVIPFGYRAPPRKRSWRPVGMMRGYVGPDYRTATVARRDAIARAARYGSRLKLNVITRNIRRRDYMVRRALRWASAYRRQRR